MLAIYFNIKEAYAYMYPGIYLSVYVLISPLIGEC